MYNNKNKCIHLLHKTINLQVTLVISYITRIITTEKYAQSIRFTNRHQTSLLIFSATESLISHFFVVTQKVF